MRVLARTRLVFGKGGVGLPVPDPLGAGGVGGVVQVVIHVDRVAFGIGEVVEEQVLVRVRIHNVVLEHIVRRVILNLEFAAAGLLRVVLVQRIVDDGAVVCTTPLAVVATDRDPV